MAEPVVGIVAEPVVCTVAEGQHELVLVEQQGLQADDLPKLGIYKFVLAVSNLFRWTITISVTYPFLPAT